MSATHKAIAFPAEKAPLVVIDVPTPSVAPGRVLIRVQYASTTPLDVWQGHFSLVVSSWPQVPGTSLSGTVLAVGEGVEHLSVGDQVFTFTAGPNDERAAQEIAHVRANRVGKVPSNITLASVATISDNLVTAFHALTQDLGLSVATSSTAVPSISESDLNKRILIWGGSTSAGQYAIQLLKLSGYRHIITTASAKHTEHLLSLGATSVVDYTASGWEAAIGEPVDLVLDNVGDVEDTLRQIGKVVRRSAESKVAALLPLRLGGRQATSITQELPSGVLPSEVQYSGVRTFLYEQNEYFKQHLQAEIIPELIASGLIKANRTRVVQGANALESYQLAVNEVAAGTVSGERLVIEIEGRF
ncbi:hypothetical protein PLICRDRAFT_37545 [Plicaturopsis crispa FD-325 SS-3]|nr:hypothetical protein PLICRDRAFT_37545 [Plicaturopsis crispa FD-325 SS-3]